MNKKSNTVAVIPARGGSKRLPRKNILDFHGKPIISYTIKAAFNSGCFKDVYVSTDDDEIADISATSGAKIIYRGEELSDDNASVVEVCLDFLSSPDHFNDKCKNFCCLYATAPLRTSEDIKCTVKLLEKDKCNFSMAVSNYNYPVHQALLENLDGTLSAKWPDNMTKKSQHVDALYVDNGSTYAVNIDAFIQHKTFYGPRLRGYLMPNIRSIDIDNQDDLEIAKRLYELA